MNNNKMNRAEPPIFFIISRPRTGSTLLRTLLDAHPNLLVPPESPFIFKLFRRYHAVNNWNAKTIEQFCNRLLKQRRIKYWALNRQQLQNALDAQAKTLNYSAACKQVLHSYDSLYQKSDIKQLGAHLPYPDQIITKWPLLLQLFPNAKFIHIVRDYRDNYLSVCRAKLERSSIPLQMTYWNGINRAAKQISSATNQLLQIQYETLASSPKKTLKQICQFIGVAFYPQQLDFHTTQKSATQLINSKAFKRYHSHLLQPISSQYTGQWRQQMPTRQIQLADYIACATAPDAGYFPHSTKAADWIKWYRPRIQFNEWLLQQKIRYYRRLYR